MKIDGHPIGDPVFIVAELSCSHEGSLDKAKELIDYAADAGCDAVKTQLWLSPDDMTKDSADARFVLQSGPWAGKTLHDLYKEAWTPPDWHTELFAYAREKGLIPFASAFSP